MADPGDTPSRADDPPPAGSEEAAWAGVVARWTDEAAHREYLARFTDLEGMGIAGRRYRAVLAERPDDPTAQQMRDVLLKKATALGLASLPRTKPREESPRLRKAKLALAFALGSVTLYLAFLFFRSLARLLGSPS